MQKSMNVCLSVCYPLVSVIALPEALLTEGKLHNNVNINEYESTDNNYANDNNIKNSKNNHYKLPGLSNTGFATVVISLIVLWAEKSF